MWLSKLQRHFPGSVWKRYYPKIMFYVLSVFYGLKPSVLWDFGPCVTPSQISNFVKELKLCFENTEPLLIVVVGSDILLSNANHCLKTLSAQKFLIEINKGNFKLMLSEENSNIQNLVKSLTDKLANCEDCEIWFLDSGNISCIPSLFGLLLNYPTIYYFNSDYHPFCTSLMVFSITCNFSFDIFCGKFQLYSFSVPIQLLNFCVQSFITGWLNILKHQYKEGIFSNLSMESTLKEIDALIL